MSTREAGMAVNQPIRGNVTVGRERILDMPRCSIYRSTDQTTTTGAAPVIHWDSIEYISEGGMFAVALGDTAIRCVTQGVYAVSWVGTWAANATNVRTGYVQKNGAGSSALSVVQPAAAGVTVQGGSAHMSLLAGDYLELVVSQATGGNLAFQGTTAANHNNVFQACLIST